MTYALLDERAPTAKYDRDQALVDVARRFFTTRGPATVHDMAKWSGLTLSDCRAGLEAAKRGFEKELLDKQEYWFADSPRSRFASPTANLLPVYDEYLSSYRGHTAIAPAEISRRLREMGLALSGVIVVDGLVVGTWKRSLGKGAARISLDPFGKLTAADYEDDVAADPRIDALRAKMQLSEDPRYEKEYHDPAKRSNANSIQVHFRDGTQAPLSEVEYPLGHRRRRAEGVPLLMEKFETNLARVFAPKQRARILEVALDQGRLEAMAVNEFVDLLTA